MSLDKAQALNAAKQYVLQRNVQSAVDIYQKLIQEDPSDVTASNTLGELFASTGQVREAIVQFSRVADTYIELGHARQAIATLQKIIAIDPGNTETATKLADLYAQAGLPSEARQHYLQIADALNRKGATTEALGVLSKIVQMDPSNTSTRIKLGELYLREGMNEPAYDAFMTAAGQLANTAEHRRALNAYNEALAIRPDSNDAFEATRRLMTLLGIPHDKGLRNTASQTDVPSGPVQEKSPRPATYDSSKASTEPGSDSFVVQEISKAEILVAYGKVNQAIAMLRQVLQGRPDNIDVHVKLKDIYLRTGMMVEAAHECIALERIHETRGESERARDYAVRASRLTNLIEQPSGDLSKTASKPVEEPERRLNSASVEATPRRDTAQLASPRPEPRHAESAPMRVAPSNPQTFEAPTKRVEPLPTPSPNRVSVVPPSPLPIDAPTKPVEPRPTPSPTRVSAVPSSPQPINVQPKPADLRPTQAPMRVSVVPSGPQAADVPLKPATERRPALQVERVANVPAATETKLAISPVHESALVPVTQPLVEARDRELPALFEGLSLDAKKRGRFTATGIAAGVFLLLGASAVIGGFAYNSHLDKEYAALSLAAPQVTEPPPPPAQEHVVEEVTQDEPITVLVTPPADTSDQRLVREREAALQAARPEQPAPSQPTSAPARIPTQPAPLLPRAVASPDVRAGSDPRTPAGVPGEVPIGPTQAAEPPPKLIRQSPGVVVGSAIQRVDPVYPIQAKEARQSGAVAVEVTISDQGNVVSARALNGARALEECGGGGCTGVEVQGFNAGRRSSPNHNDDSVQLQALIPGSASWERILGAQASCLLASAWYGSEVAGRMPALPGRAPRGVEFVSTCRYYANVLTRSEGRTWKRNHIR